MQITYYATYFDCISKSFFFLVCGLSNKSSKSNYHLKKTWFVCCVVLLYVISYLISYLIYLFSLEDNFSKKHQSIPHPPSRTRARNTSSDNPQIFTRIYSKDPNKDLLIRWNETLIYCNLLWNELDDLSGESRLFITVREGEVFGR